MNKDIVSLIARHSTVLTRMSMAQVCKQWYHILGLKSVWEQETKKLDIQKIKTLAITCYNMRYQVNLNVSMEQMCIYFVYLYPLIENSLISIISMRKDMFGKPEYTTKKFNLQNRMILDTSVIKYWDDDITCQFNRVSQLRISYINSSYIVNKRFNNKLI